MDIYWTKMYCTKWQNIQDHNSSVGIAAHFCLILLIVDSTLPLCYSFIYPAVGEAQQFPLILRSIRVCKRQLLPICGYVVSVYRRTVSLLPLTPYMTCRFWKWMFALAVAFCWGKCGRRSTKLGPLQLLPVDMEKHHPYNPTWTSTFGPKLLVTTCLQLARSGRHEYLSRIELWGTSG